MAKNELIPEDIPGLNMLKNPRDTLTARITDQGKKVLTVAVDNGKHKYSKTQYPNGTIHETKTTKL